MSAASIGQGDRTWARVYGSLCHFKSRELVNEALQKCTIPEWTSIQKDCKDYPDAITLTEPQDRKIQEYVLAYAQQKNPAQAIQRERALSNLGSLFDKKQVVAPVAMPTSSVEAPRNPPPSAIATVPPSASDLLKTLDEVEASLLVIKPATPPRSPRPVERPIIASPVSAPHVDEREAPGLARCDMRWGYVAAIVGVVAVGVIWNL